MSEQTIDGIASRSVLTDSQLDALSKLRRPDEAHVPKLNARRPASIYTSPERFEQERARIFSQVPLAITVSAILPEPGMAMPIDGFGIPLLVTRDRKGTVRVFLNGCRHRGSRLLEGCEAVRAGRVTCPYHAWTFGLDGSLIGVPRQETFPGLDRSSLGLIELTSYEAGGIIWACLDPQVKAPMVPGSDQVAAELDAFGVGGRYMYRRQTYDLPANWKLVYEPFLEGYHVQRLHANSIAPLFVDVAPVMRKIGDHIGQTSGNANFDPSILDRLHKHVTHTYQLFPNLIFISSPYYMSVMILMPRSEGRTVLDYYMLVKNAPDSEKAEDLYARSFKLAMAVFGGEDYRASTLQQEALAANLIPEVFYGGLEQAIIPFHEQIETYLERG